MFTFPAAPSERSPLRIHEFTTDAGNFAHEIGDLWQSLLFENMELNASNAPIQANVSTCVDIDSYGLIVSASPSR